MMYLLLSCQTNLLINFAINDTFHKYPSYTLACACIDPAKVEEEKHQEYEFKRDEQEPSDLGQPTDIEEISAAEVTQDREEIIELQPFEGMHLLYLHQEE